MRIAVTGPAGRLGRAVVRAASPDTALEVIPWGRPDYDLDDAASAGRLFARDHPDVVIHTAAWTDVDGCAREPAVAMRRNADAVGEIASACARTSARFVLVSTNEIFDGRRRDGRGYALDDEPLPPNPYG